jgi:threonine/homoserine/homoserine lactone efflux protein
LLAAIVESVPLAIGVALSPVPIAAVLVSLLTPRAAATAPAFLLGWILGIGIVGMIVFFLPGLETARGEPTRLAGLLAIALGTALIALSIPQWRKRPGAGHPVQVPAMLAGLDEMGAGRALAVGFILSALNPKNVGFTAAAVAAIDAAMMGPADQAVAFVVFIAVASGSIVLPILGFFASRQRAEVRFARWKDWLIAHNATVMAILLGVFGALILARGVAIVAT